MESDPLVSLRGEGGDLTENLSVLSADRVFQGSKDSFSVLYRTTGSRWKCWLHSSDFCFPTLTRLVADMSENATLET